jgi:predicted O-methyltransferase YrrM
MRRMELEGEKHGVPIIGPLVGNLISIISQSCHASKALEIGSAIGYSGVWIARSLIGRDRKLTTIELDPSMQKKAEENFRRNRVDEIVEMLAGDARDLVPKIAKSSPKSFDLVFLDVGDKRLYVDLMNDCIKCLRPNGFLIADNTLWGGAVAVPNDNSEDTVAIRKFNEALFGDERVSATIIPMRDGLTIAFKKE